jgi:hypothetical protein
LAEINTALAFEVEHKKRVIALVVGKPDLSKLPLIKAKNFMTWTGDPTPIVAALKRAAWPGPSPQHHLQESVPTLVARNAQTAPINAPNVVLGVAQSQLQRKRSFFSRLLGKH